MLTLWRCKFFIKSSVTLKVNKGHKQWPFLFNNSLFLLLMLLIEETNAAEHYERTKFDLKKDDICPVLTLTYVLVETFCPCFYFIWLDRKS